MEQYQVAVIGGGPGGYVTAIRLKQFGFNVICFEKDRLGGVCLNRGCIPTKSLVKVAELYSEIKDAEDFGLKVTESAVDYPKVYARKNEIVEKLVSGVEFIFKKKEITVCKEEVIEIEKQSRFIIKTENQEVEAEYLVIATGSVPKSLPHIVIDEERILSSNGILNMQELPQSLVVIGGGVIGCEFASIYAQMGVNVEIVEFLPSILINEDEEVTKRMTMALKKSGVKLHVKNSVDAYRMENDKIVLTLSGGKEITTDKVLVSVGRAPYFPVKLKNMELESKNGFISTDSFCRTNIDKVFAIGDINGKLLLAHVASKQGLIVAELIRNEINGEKHEVEELVMENIPRCTFTHPEIASVGLTEKQAAEKYTQIYVGRFPFAANGKALGLGNTNGFVKTIADENKMIVGMHIIGPQATELIAQGTLMIGQKMTPHLVDKIVFAHPTLSEVVMESVEDLCGIAIHKG